MNNLVSIIVPAFNVEQMITNCLTSLTVQTYKNIEIIIVDDGSTDNTGVICDQFIKENSYIKVIHQKNKGVSAARNVALSVALGDYIIFVDSDDTAGPKYVEQLMKWADYDFVTAGYYWQNSDGLWSERKFEDFVISNEILRAFPSKFLGKYYFGSPWGTLMKRKIIEKYNIRFNEKIKSGEDILFAFQYLQYAKNIKILPMCDYNYFYYPGSLVNTIHDDFWKWKIIIEDEIYHFFRPCNEKERNVLLSRRFDVLRDLLRDYSDKKTRLELREIYNDDFFEIAIKYKRKKGSFKDRILIYAMDNDDYNIYIKVEKIHIFLIRVKNKIKRTFLKDNRTRK